MNARRFAVLMVVVFAFTVSIQSDAYSITLNRLSVPYGRVKRLASPDGCYVLVGESKRTHLPQDCTLCVSLKSSLWLEDRVIHRKELLLDVTRAASAGWSPDGRSFYVEEEAGSNVADTYLYETRTRKKLDVEDLILASDPEVKALLEGHFYFRADRWSDKDHLLIHLSGHIDESPFTCFDLRYRLGRLGEVKKLSEREGPADADWCHS